jgi:hypothetical protein
MSCFFCFYWPADDAAVLDERTESLQVIASVGLPPDVLALQGRDA